jgi:release factor glutamine methyltransferase
MTPRKASEQLVEQAVAYLVGRSARVVDVGTGSGAIAIAIATAAPDADVWATDISSRAVALARANVRDRGLTDRVTVCEGDLLQPISGAVDLVVANLPYLAEARSQEYPDLAGEPTAAVFSAGDGLDPYRRLLAVCSERLTADGAVVLQLHRRVLTATRDELSSLLAVLEDSIQEFDYVPQLARAVA